MALFTSSVLVPCSALCVARNFHVQIDPTPHTPHPESNAARPTPLCHDSHKHSTAEQSKRNTSTSAILKPHTLPPHPTPHISNKHLTYTHTLHLKPRTPAHALKTLHPTPDTPHSTPDNTPRPLHTTRPDHSMQHLTPYTHTRHQAD